MKKQYEYKNSNIKKWGCFFLDHISFFEGVKNISESDVDAVYSALVDRAFMREDCFIQIGDKVQMLKVIADVLGVKLVDCGYIGKWKTGDVVFDNCKSEYYLKKFRENKDCQFCIKEYRHKNKQHFFRCSAKGDVIYDSYPNSRTVKNGYDASTRLYYLEFCNEK